MVANLTRIASSLRPKWWGLVGVVIAPIVALAGVSWWLTEPLEDSGQGSVDGSRLTRAAASVPTKRPSDVPPPWPASRLDGEAAKQVLLETLTAVGERIARIEGYTATFRKQERIRGNLGPEQTLAMKVRQQPFAVYLKFLSPNAGKEVVYAEGHHENKVIAHSTGVSRWLVPRLAVPPDHPIALADSRHAVTEAGLANLTARLIGFRRMDLRDPEAVTILDRTTDADGHLWLRSIHTHPHKAPERPFARVEVEYDPETRFPLRISSFDWPEDGRQGELLLAERYAYDNLDFDASLSALDFDPANPAYAFQR